MKNTCLLICLFLGAMFFCACKKTSSPASTSSMLVVYGCTPNLSSILNISNNGNFMVGMGYSSTDPNYFNLDFPAESEDFTFSFDDSLFAEVKQSMAANKHYSLFFGGPAANPCKLFMEDSVPVPGTGMAAIRFVNLSSDSASYTCSVNGVEIMNGLSYQNVSSYYEVATDSLAHVVFGNAGSTIAASGSQQLIPGGIYSFVLSGNAATGIYLEKVYQNPVLAL